MKEDISRAIDNFPMPAGLPASMMTGIREGLKEELTELEIESDIEPGTRIMVETTESQEFGDMRSLIGDFNPSDISVEIYKRMRVDPMIAFGLDSLKTPINNIFRLGNFRFVSDSREIAQFCQDLFDEKWRLMIRQAQNMLDFGFQAFEVPWERFSYESEVEVPGQDPETFNILRIPNAWRPRKFKDFDPEGMEFQVNGLRDLISMKPSSTAQRIPEDRSLVFTNQLEFGNLFGVARLRSAYLPWWWNSLNYTAINRYMRKKADPPIVVHSPSDDRPTPDGGKVNMLDQALIVAKAVRDGHPIAIPSEYYSDGQPMWSVDYLQDNKRSDMFLYYIQHLEIKKLHGLFIPERTLSNEDSTGSFGMIQILRQSLIESIENQKQDLVDTINTVLLPRVVKLNFGEGAPCCRLVTEAIQRTDQEKLTNIITSLLDVEKTLEPNPNSVSANIDVRDLLNIADIPLTPVPIVPERMEPPDDAFSADIVSQAQDILMSIAQGVDKNRAKMKGYGRYRAFIRGVTGETKLADDHRDLLEKFEGKPINAWVEAAIEDFKKKRI